MTASAPGHRSGGPRIVHIVLRILLVVALVVLIGLNAVRRGPELVAALSPSSPSPHVVAGATSATPAATLPASESTTPSASASVTDTTSTGGSGTGTGTGSGSGSGGTTNPKPTSKPVSHLVITSFSAENVQCPQPSGGQFASTAPSPDVIPEWNSTGAVKAWFGIDTSNAKANPYESVDPNGAVQFTWPCPSATQEYAITVEDAAGNDLTRTIVVRNTGYTG